MSGCKYRRRGTPGPLVVLAALPALLLFGAEASAHGPTAQVPSIAARSADGITPSETTPASEEHRRIDVIPTRAEEAELLRRVEEEGLGINSESGVARFTAGDPGVSGRWEALQDWPVIGVFSSLLPDGRVLTFDSVGDAPTEDSPVQDFTRASLWDPVTGTHGRVDLDTGYNAFCAGFSTLPDGRLFIAGGNADSALNGIVETHTFNPLSDSWSLGQRMEYARWYPSVTPLANGEMLITGGGFPIPEVRETDGLLRELTSASASVWDNRDYPWLQTAPDGRVAFLGPAQQLGYVDTEGSGSFQTSIQREGSQRNYGSYAMFDIGKVVVAGGGFQSSRTNQRDTRVIDLETDTVSSSGPMVSRRRQHNLTVLADGTVLATGGFASNQGLVDLDNAVYAAELWDPASGQWRTLAAEERARQYHSTALLLPDGRVLSSGGGICGDCQRLGYIQKNGQVFTPPYLFRKDGSGALADRPIITAYPSVVGHDRDFTVATNEAGSIAKVAMVRIGSVTHSQNMEQRYVPLDFSVAGDGLAIRSPRNANIAPPGHYMLFLIDSAGVPSVAKIVNVANSVEPPPPATGVVNVAIAGSAVQSSTADGADASRAIDGSTDGNAANNSVSRTAVGDQSWWELDLGEVRDIRQIVVHRREDCCTGRLSNFHVIVSATPFASASLSDTLAQPSVGDYYTGVGAPRTRLDIDRPARFVRVQLAGRQALELAEVEVLAADDGQGVACGSANVDPARDSGVHVWKECGSGAWTLMLTGEAGEGAIKAAGRLTSSLGFEAVTPRSLESTDTLETIGGTRTVFSLTTSSPWTDHFEFGAPTDSELCLGLDSITGGEQLYIGAFRIPAGVGPVNPATLEGCEFSGPDCSAPSFDPAVERALVSWVDCTGTLRLVATGGQGFARFSGHVYVSTGFAASETRSFESGDTLVAVSDTDTFFDMGTGGGARDEILLTPDGDGRMCVEITARSEGTTLLSGAARTPVSSPFDPLTGEPCEPPGNGADCGEPRIDTANDSALFVWKNCDGSWGVLLTGTASDGGVVTATGSITSSAGFDSLSPGGIESSDEVSIEPGGALSFDMRTNSPWRDDFSFTVPAGANLCVSVAGISDGADVLAGPDRTPVGTSFDPVTYSTCR